MAANLKILPMDLDLRPRSYSSLSQRSWDLFLGIWLSFGPADSHYPWSTVIPTHPVEFRCGVTWLSSASSMGEEAYVTGKQKRAELAEMSLCSVDDTRLVFQMPAVLSIWLPGDGNAALQNGKQRECTCLLQLHHLADADPHCALLSSHWAHSQPAWAS